MSMKDFLSEATIAEPPVPLPVGTYNFLVTDFAFGKSAKKGTDQVDFMCRPTEMKDDVDQELISQMKTPWDSEILKNTFYFTEKSLYRLDEFCEKCGVNMKNARSERIQDCKGKLFQGTVTHGTSERGATYANITTVEPAQ